MNKTAILYVRIASALQADPDGQLRTQEEALHDYCQANGITVKAVYKEISSGNHCNRPEWNKLLKYVEKKKGEINHVLFTTWDRFTRNAADMFPMIDRLKQYGTEPKAIAQESYPAQWENYQTERFNRQKP